MDWEGVIFLEVKTGRAQVKLIHECAVIFILNVQFVHCRENAAVGYFFYKPHWSKLKYSEVNKMKMNI